MNVRSLFVFGLFAMLFVVGLFFPMVTALPKQIETFPLEEFVIPSSDGSYWVLTKYSNASIKPFLICLGEKDIRPYWVAAPAYYTKEVCD